MRERFKIKRKTASFQGRALIFIFVISGFLLLTGCLNEEISIDLPKPGLEQIQMHNFNTPLNGGSLEGSAPDIFYFWQKEDGTYVFILSSNNYEGFETKWLTEYILVTTDARGIIKKTEVRKFPVKNGRIGNFERVFDSGIPPANSPVASAPLYRTSAIGPNYVADAKGMLYHIPDETCLCANIFFNLHPDTGPTTYYSTGGERPLAQSFRTSDGGFITIGSVGAPDYNKFSASGKLEFKQAMKYWETGPNYVYLTDKDGDYYFITTYQGPLWYNLISENTASSFYHLRYTDFWMPPQINIEIRFGPGKGQKAHRFNRHFDFQPGGSWEYQDYVDVPFEVWDVTNNQQLMATFRDQGEDGKFNLVPLNIDWGGFPIFPGPFNDDPSQSQEWIVGNRIPYSDKPNGTIMSLGPFGAWGFVLMGYLTEGATWDPASLPSSTVSLKVRPRPGTQILKVNALGSSVVKDNYALGTVPLQNMFKAVPYLDGSAILINVPNFNRDFPALNVVNPATQLVLMDAAFNQKLALDMKPNPVDRAHQLISNETKDRIFYSRITSNPEVSVENAFKGSILLTVIQDFAIKAERYLDEFIPFKLETYRMTPTRDGGVAIVAWVRPTKDTRDLLFLELDENLNLANR